MRADLLYMNGVNMLIHNAHPHQCVLCASALHANASVLVCSWPQHAVSQPQAYREYRQDMDEAKWGVGRYAAPVAGSDAAATEQEAVNDVQQVQNGSFESQRAVS